MKKIIFNLYFIVLVFVTQFVYAQVVATVCIENKHTEKSPCDATLYVENKLMDVFFDEGFIVTNLACIKEEILLPCKNIYCKVIKRSSSKVLYEEMFELEKINGIGIYKKLDFCLTVFNEKIVDAIRRSK